MDRLNAPWQARGQARGMPVAKPVAGAEALPAAGPGHSLRATIAPPRPLRYSPRRGRGALDGTRVFTVFTSRGQRGGGRHEK